MRSINISTAISPSRWRPWSTVVKRDVAERADKRVVVADQRDVVGHPQPGAFDHIEGAERAEVVAGEDRRDRPARCQRSLAPAAPDASVNALDTT